MHPSRMHMVLLLVSAAAVAVGAQQLLPEVDVDPISRKEQDWHVQMVNGLSNAILFAHCKSKDTDIGGRYIDLGAGIKWAFTPNFWGTTLFYCYLGKPNAKVSLDVFWIERRTQWLSHRCTKSQNCIWIAKDDGIYIRNLADNVDEVIHHWNE